MFVGSPPPDELEWDDLPGLFPALPDPGRWLPLLQKHADLVATAAPRVRVTSVGRAEAVRRHYAESLELLRIALTRGPFGLLVDVGSGAGYPGMVIAAVLPAVDVHLVEPLKKRAGLLTELASALGMTNVRIHAERAEEAGRGILRDQADLVTARAVAPLRELLEYTAPLARAGGIVALPKGSGVADEIEGARRAMEELNCALIEVAAMRPEVNGVASVVLLAKTGASATRYPRRPGIPAKRPL